MSPPAPKSKQVKPQRVSEVFYYEAEVPTGEPLVIAGDIPAQVQILTAHPSGSTHTLFKYVVIREAS